MQQTAPACAHMQGFFFIFMDELAHNAFLL